MELPSKILQEAVDQLAALPGVGKRSALRYALHLVGQEEAGVRDLSEALLRLKTDLHHCRHCHNISDTEICPICASSRIIRATAAASKNSPLRTSTAKVAV